MHPILALSETEGSAACPEPCPERKRRSSRGVGGRLAVVGGRPMKAMILAAGQGTRLRPLTEHIPKCMVPLGGKPLLEHTIGWLQRYGVTELMINLHHLPDAVMNHFGDGGKWGVKITYSVEKEPLGTAGGVKNVEWFFDGPFFVWYGDNLSTCNLRRLYRFHRDKGGVASIALYHREDPTASGIVGLDENGPYYPFPGEAAA